MTAELVDEDEMIATLSDYLDGALSKEREAEVAAKIESDPAWKTTHQELRETRDALSGLQKARAPVSFTEDVTGTIRKRSAGAFFTKRTLGDRVPFGVLLIVALVALIAIGVVLWSSRTGSLKVNHESEPRTGSGAAPTM